jgi:hypothetical protein
MRTAVLAAVFGFSFAAAAATAAPLQDQFGEPAPALGDARVIFFSADMESSDLVTGAFAAEEKDLMAEAGVVYVADVSRMPGLISRLVAKPKMRRYPFRIVLDEAGEVTSAWPRQAGAITVIEGDGHRFCADVACLQEALHG